MFQKSFNPSAHLRFLLNINTKKAEAFEFSIFQQGSAPVRSRTALFLSNTTPPTSFPHRKLQIFKNPRFHRRFSLFIFQKSSVSSGVLTVHGAKEFPRSRVPLWCRSVERPAATNPGLEISEAGIESSVPAIAAHPFVSTTRPHAIQRHPAKNPTPARLHG